MTVTFRCLLTAAVLPAAASAGDISGIVLGPITPVYRGNADGTSFTASGWFPDAQFPLVWGGKNEPNTNLSWWMERHSGSMRLDYVKKDGVWPKAQYNSPDERGYWIQNVYRPVDIDPSLRGTEVELTIYPDNAVYGTPSATVKHVIDEDYLVGFAHIEDWSETLKKEINGSRTIYSFDNGKNWKKGPLWAMGICTVDNRTTPGTPRLIRLSQDYQGPGWKTWTNDIAKGTTGFNKESNAFSHGNLYGFTGILWNRYLNKWMVMYGFNGSHGKDLQFLTTAAFNTYATEPSSSIEKNEVPGRGVVAGMGDYPTLLGGFPEASEYPIPFNMEIGQLGWVYNKANGGLSGRAIHFISPAEKSVTWNGATAANIAVATIVDHLPPAPSLKVAGETVGGLDDTDGDGVVNLIEHATGTALDAPNPMPGKIALEPQRFCFHYTRAASAQAVTNVEWSADLQGPWTSEGITEEITAVKNGLLEICASLPREGFEKRFMRLKATGSSQSLASGGVSTPVNIGGGISLTLENPVISKSGGASVWTFTRTGPTDVACTVRFSVTGTAEHPADFSLAGAATFDGASGSVVIPAGETSASIAAIPTASATVGRTILVSAENAVHLSTVGNWSVASGTFTGITDEANTLNFNSAAGGMFENDIPVNKRVRSINFSAASGDHTINGNRIELEAVTKWVTTGYGTYSINQYAAKQAIFNTDINTRSAALYLRPWVAGGKITLNGNVDLLGTGGVVISGPGDVAINGGISDSGYSDFRSGQKEFVASVNPGRLIMAGDGTLTLAGDNSFAGRSSLKYGTVRIEHPGALKNSVVSIWRHNGLVPATDFKLGGLDGTGHLDLGANQLTLGNHNPLDCYSTSYSGILSGDGSVTKIDTNTQKLGAVNRHTGGTIVKGGVLEIPGSTRTAFGTGAIRFDGGTLRAGGPIVADNPVHVGAGGGTLDSNGRTVTFNGALSGGGTLNATGTGTLVLGNSGTFTGTLSFWNTVWVDQPNAFGTGALRIGGKLVLGADQWLSGLTTIATNTSVDTGPHTLTVDGPISVASGRTLTKSGSGTLAWSGDASLLLGNLVVNSGVFRATTSGDLTGGNLTLNGANLLLRASGTGQASIDIARSAGRRLTINGAASLSLDKGNAAALTVTIGSAENPDALSLGEDSTVVATLGPDTKLKVGGQPSTPDNSIFRPSFLLAAPDLAGDFAVYSLTDGFRPFAGYVPRSGSWTADAGEIPNITAATTLAANATVNGLRVNGSSALTLTSRVLTFSGVEEKAGLILNNGSLTGGAIDFGANKGFIYTSGANASIASAIRGTGGIVFTGAPGTRVKLTCWEAPYSKRLTVAGTTVELPNVTVMGADGTPVTLDGNGTLDFTNSFSFTRDLTFGSGGAGISVAAGKSVTNSGTFSGSGAFRKTGAGYLKFGGPGTSSGPISVDEGTLEYISTAIQNSTGPITVAAGARVNLSYTSTALSHDFRIEGDGFNNDGALAIGGSGTTSSSITLTGDAKIQANSGATFGIYGPIYGQGNALKFGGSGRFGLHSSIDIEGADLTLQQTPYLSVKTAASLVCENLTTSANSTLELNTPNARVANATIGGVLKGQKGRLAVTGAVTIASGGTIAGGFLDTPDLLTIAGDLTLAAGSVCHSYLEGATGASSNGTGSQHGQILVTGSGVVGGTLVLQRDGAYTPAAGDEIFVMLRNGGSGNFAGVKVIDGATTETFDGAQGSTITLGGRTGVIRYNSHSSINLSDPTSGSDISIKF